MGAIRAEGPGGEVDDLAKQERLESRLESKQIKLRAQELANEQLDLENQQLRQDNDNRKLYAGRLYKLLCFWLVGLFVILFLQGFSQGISQKQLFSLPEKVLLAVIGGTTLSVLGLFTIAVRYLFPSKEKK